MVTPVSETTVGPPDPCPAIILYGLLSLKEGEALT